jgi:hypothetical protein
LENFIQNELFEFPNVGGIRRYSATGFAHSALAYLFVQGREGKESLQSLMTWSRQRGHGRSH